MYRDDDDRLFHVNPKERDEFLEKERERRHRKPMERRGLFSGGLFGGGLFGGGLFGGGRRKGRGGLITIANLIAIAVIFGVVAPRAHRAGARATVAGYQVFFKTQTFADNKLVELRLVLKDSDGERVERGSVSFFTDGGAPIGGARSVALPRNVGEDSSLALSFPKDVGSVVRASVTIGSKTVKLRASDAK